jgi:hypothetical protein
VDCPGVHQRQGSSAVFAASAPVAASADRSATTATGRAADFASRSATELSVTAATDVAVRAAAEFSAAAGHRAHLTRTCRGAADPAAVAELLTAANPKFATAALVSELLTSCSEIAIADPNAIFASEAVAITVTPRRPRQPSSDQPNPTEA